MAKLNSTKKANKAPQELSIWNRPLFSSSQKLRNDQKSASKSTSDEDDFGIVYSIKKLLRNEKYTYKVSDEDRAYRRKHAVVPMLDAVHSTNPMLRLPKVNNAPLSIYGKVTDRNVKLSVKFAKKLKASTDTAERLIKMSSSMIYGDTELSDGRIKEAKKYGEKKTSILGRATAAIIRSDRQIYTQKRFVIGFEKAYGKRGDLHLADGDCDDFHTGNGYYHFPNGDYFEGYWEDGQPRWGMYIHVDGERYLGGLSNGIKHGTGLSIYTDASVYYGVYKYGQKHIGTMWYRDGVYCGEFEHDCHEGYGMAKFMDGNAYTGKWAEGVPNI